MKQATPEFSDLVRRLLAHEVAGNENPSEMARATEITCQKLHKQLGKLVGSEGFRVVLDRALDLARADFSFLKGTAIEAQTDCCFKGLEQSVAGQDPVEANLALVAVLANLIWLLSVFMGKDMAMRQIRRAWPSFFGMTPEEQEHRSEEAKQ